MPITYTAQYLFIYKCIYSLSDIFRSSRHPIFAMVTSMSRWVGKVAVITGASSGMGAAIVKRLLAENLIVVGIARRKEKIEMLSDSKNLHSIKADLTKEEDILHAFEWIKDNLGPIHILINSAGMGRVTNYLDGETSHWKEMMDTNYFGLCICTREALKSMRGNNVDGHIIHINDIGANKSLGLEGLNVYFSTKSPITSAVEGLRTELNAVKSKIKISCINPGYVKTEILEACVKAQPETKQFFDDFDKNSASLIDTDIADAAVYLLSTPPHVQVHNVIIQPVGQTY